MSIDDKKDGISVWKIDNDSIYLEGEKTPQQIISFIIAKYRENIANQQITLVDLKSDYKNITLYTRVREGYTWEKFIGGALSNNAQNILFKSTNPDFICFVVVNKNVYLITSGSGFRVAEKYVDTRFPIEIVKRIFKKGFNSSQSRNMIGEKYAETGYYRSPYQFSQSESITSIWKNLSGKIDRTVVDSYSKLKEIVDEKDINADARSSFVIKKKISFDDVIAVIKEFDHILKSVLSSKRKKDFSFLDSLEEIKLKTTKDELRYVLSNSILEILKGDSSLNGFDFCHRSEVEKFRGGTDFNLITNGKKYSIIPTQNNFPSSDDLFECIRTNNLFNTLEPNDLVIGNRLFKQMMNSSVEFRYGDDPGLPLITDDLISYLHGEIESGTTKYFLVDGLFFKPVGKYLENLSSQFVDEIFSNTEHFITPDLIKLLPWLKHEEESKKTTQEKGENYFIEKHVSSNKKIIIGHKKLVSDFELFDILLIDNNTTYIIHIKNGFNGKVRDLVSQVRNSASIIEHKFDDDKLKLLYKKLDKQQQDKYSEKSFLGLFNNKKREIVYVAACAGNPIFSKGYVNSSKTSKIALLELILLKNHIKGMGRKFKFSYIQKI